MGPMVAAARFIECLRSNKIDDFAHIRVTFYGSLAFTGKGHGSDRAVMLGLLGENPKTLDPEIAEKLINKLKDKNSIDLRDLPKIKFNPESDIIFNYGDPLPAHPNGMVFTALNAKSEVALKRAYYSVGGGFVLSEDEIEQNDNIISENITVPYPFQNAKSMLEMGRKSSLSIAQMKEANELSIIGTKDFASGIDNIWAVMSDCINRGLAKSGILPGSLKIKRRAADIKVQLDDEVLKNSQNPHICNEWLSLYAMAVNEENVAGGRVVTAPTNGAAGVIPAVLRYYLDFVPSASFDDISVFLLNAAAIGGIIKNNASISGAEVGCQGEVGSASAMAAAGLCAVMGGSNEQIENAAEIALEHHLGMTCDPVAGLVQVPCIERNGMGAVKAVTASALALRGDGTHFISLDVCIETMRQTGLDMRSQYKETSQGGLAVNVTEC